MDGEKSSDEIEISLTGSRKMQFTAATVAEELTSKVKDLVKSEPETSVKGRIRAAARHLGLSPPRVENYWYGEVRCPPAHEADLIRAYYKAAQELINARKEYDAIREQFLARNPRLAWLAPPAVAKGKGELRAEAALESELTRKRSR